MKTFLKTINIHKILCALAWGLFCIAGTSNAFAQSSVCARVVLQIRQQMTLEREAFEATLNINNGQNMSIEDITVKLHFYDEQGNEILFSTPEATVEDALFFVRLQNGTWNPDSEQSIPAEGEKEAVWLMVPAIGAAGENPSGKFYSVGATIVYRMGGVLNTVDVQPDYIQVKPMPDLLLQYFLPGDILGDNPMTPEKEASEAAPFAVRVVNRSLYAAAKKVKIESNQPEIIGNQSNLPIDFRILGSQVNGKQASQSLLVDFGDIQASSSGMAWWHLVSTLSGRFISVRGEVTHAIDLGGSLTSLVQSDDPMVRRLLGVVLVDLPGRDTITDFIATDTFSQEMDSVSVYESDSAEIGTPIDFVSDSDSRVRLAGSGNLMHLSIDSFVSTAFYLRLSSPVAAMKQIRVTRSDGKVLPAQNAWISRAYNGPEGERYLLNIFDTAKKLGDTYSIVFSDAETNHAPEITFSPESETYTLPAGRLFTLHVAAHDPDGSVVSLKPGLLPAGASFTETEHGQGLFSWKPSVGQEGHFSVRFLAYDGAVSTSRSAFLQVVSGTMDWNAWLERYFGNETDPAKIGSESDPDNDGLPNLMEYAFDMNPLSGLMDGQPVPEIVGRDGKRYLALRYRLRAGDTSLLAKTQVSSDLFAWHELNVIAEPVGDPKPSLTGTVQEYLVVDTMPLTQTENRRFIRLVVERKSAE